MRIANTIVILAVFLTSLGYSTLATNKTAANVNAIKSVEGKLLAHPAANSIKIQVSPRVILTFILDSRTVYSNVKKPADLNKGDNLYVSYTNTSFGKVATLVKTVSSLTNQ
jgi:hypothetical protein